MPPRQATEPPQPPPAPPAPDPRQTPPEGTEARLGAIEQRQDRQEGLLQQILDRLPGKNPSSGSTPNSPQDPDEGKPIGQLVREGVEKLEAEKGAKAKAETEASERADHAARIKKLEEARPREVAATPAGRFRAAVQKYGFGITDQR